MLITTEQMRAARAMLGWKQQELAEKAQLSTGTLNNIERGVQKDPKLSTLKAIQHALEAAGITFTESADGALGVQLRSPHPLAKSLTVLIIDDNATDRTLFITWLSKHANRKLHAVEASNAAEGYDALLKTRPAVILLDFNMYGINGLQLIAEMKNEIVHLPPIIFITGMPSEEVERAARKSGVHSYVSKFQLTSEKLWNVVSTAVGIT